MNDAVDYDYAVKNLGRAGVAEKVAQGGAARSVRAILALLFALGLVLAGVSWAQSHLPAPSDAAVPALPFPDNPDPNACGIPQRWGDDAPAWLSGVYQGELVQPVVFLYDSHLRRAVTGSAKSGTEVRIILYQPNPVLDFYYVITSGDDPQRGWVPAPFLRFTPEDPSGTRGGGEMRGAAPGPLNPTANPTARRSL